MAETLAPVRHSGPLPTARARRRYAAVVAALAVLAGLFGFGVLAWDNPMPL